MHLSSLLLTLIKLNAVHYFDFNDAQKASIFYGVKHHVSKNCAREESTASHEKKTPTIACKTLLALVRENNGVLGKHQDQHIKSLCNIDRQVLYNMMKCRNKTIIAEN